MLKTGLVADPAVREHDTGPGHPEQQARYSAVMERLQFTGLLDFLTHLNPRLASADELALVHTPAYISLAEDEVRSHRTQLSTGDTTVSSGSFDAALRAAGCALAATEAVMQAKVSNAFCVVRPPGHHASQERGMGFCLFNNIAIAARHAQKRYGLDRVAIVDWDVHHGNGTQDIFYEDPSVLFFSTHQSPWYPGTGAAGETGAGSGVGTTLNCPFPAGAGRREVLGAFQQVLLPKLHEFRPELILISAGFDSRVGDPLGGFLLEDEDFVTLTRLLLEASDQYAGGRVVSVLEGGYSLSGLASAATAHVRAMCNVHD
jgi:acetoin utilization deacetylase AcuC-like enzyme